MSKIITDLTPAVSEKRVGLIGIGRMGVGIGTSFLRHGAHLNVKGNIQRTNIERLTALGATEYGSVIEIGKASDIVILSLPSSREVESVCLGKAGLFANLPRGSILIDTSTSHPSSTVALAEKAGENQIKFVDCPVTRSPKEAELGKLNSIVGADEEVFSEVAGIIAAFSETIIHAGPVGAGHKLKLLNNALSMGTVALAAEACMLATDLGIEIETLRALVSRGATNNGIFQGMCAFLLNEDPNALAFSISNAAKDVRYVLEQAKEVQACPPVLESVSAKFNGAVEMGLGDKTLPYLTEACVSNRPKSLPNTQKIKVEKRHG